MKKFGIFILMLVLALSLSSCKKDDLPEGMQLVCGGEEYGYNFYAPEEWTVSNVGEIKSAFASRVDSTSISFAEVFGEHFNKSDKTDEEYFFSDYFNDSLSGFAITPTVTISGEAFEFGTEENKADRVLKYAFNYEYKSHKFGFLQLFIKEGDRYFILTYTALLEERSDGKTYYEYHTERLTSVINNFEFITYAPAADNTEEEIKDADGYILVSDKSLCGFELFVPEGFKKDYASAIVSASHEDKSNITLTEATSTGVAITDYWEKRKADIEAITGSTVTEIKVNEPAKLGNANTAFSYEYTFVYNNEVYHIYQVLAIEGPLLLQKGYVLTFTAKEEVYSTHIDEILKTAEKVNFK
jgi:hypothetical protein